MKCGVALARIDTVSEAKIIASVYKVQYEHVERGVVGCVHVFVPNSSGYVSVKNSLNWMMTPD